MIPAWICNHIHYKMWDEINYKSIPKLKFTNGWVILSHTLWCMWLLIHAGIKGNCVNQMVYQPFSFHLTVNNIILPFLQWNYVRFHFKFIKAIVIIGLKMSWFSIFLSSKVWGYYSAIFICAIILQFPITMTLIKKGVGLLKLRSLISPLDYLNHMHISQVPL